MHSLRDGPQDKLIALGLALLLAVLWLLMRGYQGFVGDAQIYAFQALARIHPALSTDLYLQNGSQDQYTLFSPLYAGFIQWLGLESAARLLTLFFTAWMVAAAWNLAAAATDKSMAWLAAAFFVIADGEYGASGVFRLFEPFLTARLPAQALIITAIACHLRGVRLVGWVLGMAALVIHPLMALPGLLVLICLRLPSRLALIGAAGGVCAALGIALTAGALRPTAHALGIMDAAWLEVVEERSQFLFPQLWSLRDWDVNLRPLLYLAFIALLLDDARSRRLCIAALLVGTCGLTIAVIASLEAPVALLVQGQAWRWVWPACLLSTLLLPAALFRTWSEEKGGPLCTILLMCGWVLPAVGGTACVVLAVVLWLKRSNFKQRQSSVDLRTDINRRASRIVSWVAIAASVAAVAWVIRDAFGHNPMTLDSAPALPAVKGFSLLLFGGLWKWLRGARSTLQPAIVCALLLIASIFVIPLAFKHARVLVSPSDHEEFADWSRAIPPGSAVLVTPPRDVGSFVWFTLERTNYLALDQSAGVVFSRATALEVRRRSEVLQPLMNPTWKILSGMRASAVRQRKDPPTRPLTAETLVHVCEDPKLGFVIAPQDVGFERLRHEHSGAWKDWNLYDCAPIRLARPRT